MCNQRRVYVSISMAIGFVPIEGSVSIIDRISMEIVLELGKDRNKSELQFILSILAGSSLYEIQQRVINTRANSTTTRQR